MGGRGGASGFPTNAPIVPQTPQSAAETKDLNELKSYMSNVGVNVDVASLSGQTFENVRGAAAAIEKVINEFPQARRFFNLLRGDTLGRGEFANATFSGNITLANHYFSKTDSDLDRSYDRSLRSGFHPAGTTKYDIASHEAGHVLESALIQKYVYQTHSGYAARLQSSYDWNKCTYASKVVSEACRDVKRIPAGKGMKNADIIRNVSGYAIKNRSETLAECVADYSANGTRAKPLSVAVWNILKRELG